MNKSLMSSIAMALVLIFAPPQAARAQWVVFDPANFGEAFMTALQTLQSNVNEATQIANQIQSLNHEIRNLQQFPGGLSAALVNDYVLKWNQLSATFRAINGLAGNLGNLNAAYAAQYPNRNIAGPLTSAQVIAQIQAQLNAARQSYVGVYRTSGDVMAAIPQSQANLSSALAASQGANGNLDAIQAETQVTAQVATLLMDENAQLAAMYQAEANSLNQQAELVDNAHKLALDAAVNYTSPSGQPPAPYLPILH
jgi:type IV secretion system protein TrbJ